MGPERPPATPAWPRARRRLAAAVALGGLAVGALLLVTGVLHPAELATLDARFAVRGDRSPETDRLLLVELDGATLTREGFPLPRHLYGEAIARLDRDGARAVALDVQITEPSSPAEDDALIDALHRHPGTLMSSTESRDGRTRVLGTADNRRYARVRVADTTFPVDSAATLRRYRAEQDGVPTLAAAVASALGRPTRFSGTRWIDYSGPPGHHASVSLLDLLAGRVPASRIRGRIVVIGATASSLQDFHATSVLRDEPMSGAEIQLNAISSALRGQPLRSTPGWLEVLLTLALTAGVPAALALRRPLVAAGVLALVVLAGLGLAQLAFQAGWVVPVATPLAGLLVVGAAAITGTYALELAVRTERLRAARARTVEAADQARRAVERDLHDGAQQRLLALAMMLQDPAPDRDLTRRAVDEVMRTLAELRSLARGVYPEALTRDGLEAGLDLLASDAPLPVRCTGRAGPRAEARAEQALYFVAAEGLANAIKHAAAAAVTFALARKGDWLELEVTDDGRGGADAGGSGLIALAERVEAVGGALTVRSPAGGGTRLLARVPAGTRDEPQASGPARRREPHASV